MAYLEAVVTTYGVVFIRAATILILNPTKDMEVAELLFANDGMGQMDLPTFSSIWANRPHKSTHWIAKTTMGRILPKTVSGLTSTNRREIPGEIATLPLKTKLIASLNGLKLLD
jgi:hypothetical protein